MIITVALYSVVVVPLRIGVNTTLWDPVYDIMDLITWIIYIADVFINLRTTYVDNFGMEIHETGKITMNYVGSFRFIIDVLSLVNFPSIMLSSASKGTAVILNTFGLLKISRYFRAQRLIIESRLSSDEKTKASCCFYFVLLLLYLHMIGCLFFYFCLTTYEKSSTRLGIMDGLGLRQVDPSDPSSYIYPFPDPFKEDAEACERALAEKSGPNAQIYAWVPAYDNYDGSEQFWRHYELSLITED